MPPLQQCWAEESMALQGFPQVVVTSPAPGGVPRPVNSRGTNPDVPTVCSGDGIPMSGFPERWDQLWERAVIYYSVSYQLY